MPRRGPGLFLYLFRKYLAQLYGKLYGKYHHADVSTAVIDVTADTSSAKTSFFIEVELYATRLFLFSVFHFFAIFTFYLNTFRLIFDLIT